MKLILALLASLLAGSPLAAQASLDAPADTFALRGANPLSLRPGARIRLAAPSIHDPWVEGHVIDYDGSSFAFTIEGRPSVVYLRDYQDVSALDVRRRLVRSSAREGALWGFYLGSTLGIIAGSLAANELSIGSGTSMAYLGSGGAMLGALTGAATGALLAPGRWYGHVLSGGN
jgi:hypothetical protein